MCNKRSKSQSPPGCDSPAGRGSSEPLRVTQEQEISREAEAEELMFMCRKFWNMGLVWRNILLLGYTHVVGVYGLYLWFSGQFCWQTVVAEITMAYIVSFGITAGAHRLWSHKCYKAKLPLRILLCLMQTCSGQNSLWDWCRDHRVHHKFSETDADPHNVKRGFFFAHVGWLFVRKHEEVKVKGNAVDMSDLEQDPVVMFQKRYFVPLTLLFCFYLPFQIHVYFGEPNHRSWIAVMTRYMISLNFTWLVNSAAHTWGRKPYDNHIHAVENKFVSLMTTGEGWHNYHHIFPWDYKAAELTTYNYNWAKGFIDLFAWIGWAYDLKTVPEEVVLARVRRTGDGSHSKHHHDEGQSAWGWDDKDIGSEEKDLTVILNKKDQ